MSDSASMERRVVVDDLWQEFRPRTAHGSFRRGERFWALRGVSFSIGAGETLGILGQNGSGKTTLLKSLAGVLTPSRGRIETFGRVSSLIELNAGINRDMSGRENIMLGGVLLGMSRAEVRSKYDEIAAFSGLERPVLEQPISSYSSGMGLRIAFSVIACSEPSVLLIDEVLAVGDDAFQQKCLEQIQQFRRSGCSIALASHNLELIREQSTSAIALAGGEVVAQGTPDQVVRAYRPQRELPH
jgi:lipopolysaccharide transport system ATP-binding protein